MSSHTFLRIAKVILSGRVWIWVKKVRVKLALTVGGGVGEGSRLSFSSFFWSAARSSTAVQVQPSARDPFVLEC